MRTALTISAVAHALMWAPLALLGADPKTSPAETPIMAEIVSSAELDKTPQEQTPKQTPKAPEVAGQPETTTPETPTPTVRPERQAAPPQKRDDQARPQGPKDEAPKSASAVATPAPADAPTEQPQPWSTWLDSALGAPLAAAASGLDPAEHAAKLSQDDVKAFRARLQECWKPPPGLANARVVLRISLRPNGALAAEPTLLAGSASKNGVLLMQVAKQALDQCQPYGFLPTAEYKEWKVLDLSFSSAGLSGFPRI